MRNTMMAGMLMSGLAASSPVFAQTNADEVTQLKQRVLQLEQQVQEISQFLEPLKAQRAKDNRRTALRRSFEQRMARDRDKYSPAQLREAEQLMRVADEKWGSPDANESCQTLIEKYPDLNRAGCAMLYLAQSSQGDELTKRLQVCVEKYNDCFYGDGVQVGAYARFLLAQDYRSKGEAAKAEALITEIKTNYAEAIDHGGNLLIDRLKASSK